MCLSRVDFHTKNIKTGYKVVRRVQVDGLFCLPNRPLESDKLSSEYQGNHKKLPFNVWLHEKDYRSTFMRHLNKDTISINVCTTYTEEYPAGFHIFVTRRAAKSWQETGGISSTVIVKVRVRECVASGYERCGLRWHNLAFYRAVIAKQIKIVEVLHDLKGSTLPSLHPPSIPKARAPGGHPAQALHPQ